MKNLLLSWLIVLSVLFGSSQGFQDPGSPLTFHVFLGAQGDNSRPQDDVFVCILPTDHIRGDAAAVAALVAWLRKNAKPPSPKVHRFSIVDGKLMPKRSIVFVGDSLHRKVDDVFPLVIYPFFNSEVGGFDPDYKLERSERSEMALRVDAPGQPTGATVLVTDHTVNGITDKNGKVEFASLPRQEKLTFFIITFPEDRSLRFQYSCPTIAMEGKGRITIDSRVPSQEHFIYLKAIPK